MFHGDIVTSEWCQRHFWGTSKWCVWPQAKKCISQLTQTCLHISRHCFTSIGPWLWGASWHNQSSPSVQTFFPDAVCLTAELCWVYFFTVWCESTYEDKMIKDVWLSVVTLSHWWRDRDCMWSDSYEESLGFVCWLCRCYACLSGGTMLCDATEKNIQTFQPIWPNHTFQSEFA